MSRSRLTLTRITRLLPAGCLFIATVVGCDSGRPLPEAKRAAPSTGLPPTEDEMQTLLADPAQVRFADHVTSNRENDGTIAQLEFVNTEGERITLDRYVGKKNVLLVFTRGFSGQLCPFCSTQTSRLITNYDEFQRRDTEVLLVYPGQTEQLDEFKAASIENSGADKFPFPVLLDENLAAVNRLDIAAQLAHPSIFIIDKRGSVRLSYVGQSPVDRPSVKALLTQLDRLQ